MILKACVCVCVSTGASAFLITDVCVILRVYFKVSIVHRPMHVQEGCVSMQGLACTEEKCLGTRVCVHVCTPVCHSETYTKDLTWVQCLPSPSSISVAYCCVVLQLPGLP